MKRAIFALVLLACQHPPPSPVEPTIIVGLDAQAPLIVQACQVLNALGCPEAASVQKCQTAAELAPLSNVSAFDAPCVLRADRTKSSVRACGARCP